MKRVLTNILVAGSVLAGMAFGTAALGAEAAAAKSAVPDAEKGAALYTKGDTSRGILACVACHGANGNSGVAMYPNLAGLPHEYIALQLAHFKAPADKLVRGTADGKPTLMAPIVAQMTAEDMQNLSVFLSKQQLTQPAKAKQGDKQDVVSRGRQIWRAGIPGRSVPACASCHGATGQGIPSAFPRLSGQHPEYLEAQLQAFADGYRKQGGAENMMGKIANRMDKADIKAVADYAAGIR